MRWALLIFYLLLVAVMDVFVMENGSRRQVLGAVAAHELPANWRLERSDVAPFQLAGRFTNAPIHKGQAFTPAGLTTTPRLIPNAGELLVAVPTSVGTPQSLNAGASVLICQESSPVVGPFDLKAKVCDGTQCRVFLSVPTAKAAALSGVRETSRVALSSQGCGS